MAVNKVIANGTTLIDLTSDTLTDASQLASGVTALNNKGELITGTATGSSGATTYTLSDNAYTVTSDNIKVSFNGTGSSSFNCAIEFEGEGGSPEGTYLYEDQSTSDLANFANGSYVSYWKIGNIVSMFGDIIFNGNATGYVPTGYRPAVDVNSDTSPFIIKSDGTFVYNGTVPTDGYEYTFQAFYTTELGTKSN